MEPNTNNTAQQETTPPNHGMGALVGTLIVLAVLVLGGVYFFLNQQMAEQPTPPVILGDAIPTSPEQNSPALSTSDTVDAIDADVSATDLNQLEAQIDADLKVVEASL